MAAVASHLQAEIGGGTPDRVGHDQLLPGPTGTSVSLSSTAVGGLAGSALGGTLGFCLTLGFCWRLGPCSLSTSAAATEGAIVTFSFLLLWIANATVSGARGTASPGASEEAVEAPPVEGTSYVHPGQSLQEPLEQPVRKVVRDYEITAGTTARICCRSASAMSLRSTVLKESPRVRGDGCTALARYLLQHARLPIPLDRPLACCQRETDVAAGSHVRWSAGRWPLAAGL